MTRCKHKNLILIEVLTVAASSSVVNGVWQDDMFTESPGETNHVQVKCLDCGLDREYYKWGRLPNWLKPHVDAIRHTEAPAP